MATVRDDDVFVSDSLSVIRFALSAGDVTQTEQR
jgi:hypothetical protein